MDGRVITLVDTPGFDDTHLSDVDVLQVVSSWLSGSYKSQRLLSGIIYLYPITSIRMRGSALKSLDVFVKLVGPDSFRKITLVTSMWDLLADPAVGEVRENDLREQFWANLIAHGSTTARSLGDRQSALAIVKHIAFGGSTSLISDTPIAIQKELVDEHRPLEETSAGEVLMRRMDTLERSYQDQLSALMHDMERDKAQMMKDRELMQTLQSEVDRLRHNQLAIHEEQLKMKTQPSDIARHKADLAPNYMRPNIYVRVGSKELLEADLPPPYSSRASYRMADTVAASLDIIAFSLTPIIELHRLLRPVVLKALRPRLQKKHSRIEWTCVSESQVNVAVED